MTFEVSAPDLWSPAEPNLYELRASLRSEHGEDAWSCRTGFREVGIRGNRFELNGERLVLNGVCRHDMWKDQGFTLTRQQMAQDMGMIKGLGANFVRLVHYPHHRHIVELADELGLLVSEEPGYWGMDFRTMPRSMIELGYRIMEGTIRRDWNSPSVFAWLLGNECRLTVEYLREGKERCRKLDPLARPVSFANNMNAKEAKRIFEQAGMDFFDQHVYPSDFNEYRNTAEFFGDSRPLTFTEWGWETAGDKDIFPETHSELILELVESGKLAGHAFWSWQDMREYSRLDWRHCRRHLDVRCRKRIARGAAEACIWNLEPCFGAAPRSRARRTHVPPCCRSSGRRPRLGRASIRWISRRWWRVPKAQRPGRRSKRPWRIFGLESPWRKTSGSAPVEKFLLWQGSEVEIAGIPFHIPTVNNYVRPVLLTPETPEVTISVGQECERLHILGQVTFPVGYPVVGKRGERVATYRVRYSGGREREVPVRNGMEVAQSNRIHVATRIDPVATGAQRALEYVKDMVREQYQVLLWSVPVERGRVESVRCKLEAGQPALAVFAITVEVG